METRSSLFAGVTPVAKHNVKAANALVARLRPLPSPCSLAEAALSESDYRWLRDWAAGLEGATAHSWVSLGWDTHRVDGKSWSAREVLGLLIMALACEVGRREATEGVLWNVVNRCFRPAAQGELFAQGQPRRALREALEGTALKAGLRNVFGQEGTQAWYLSVFLQFGFTRRGLARLPYWLSGDTPSHSVGELRGTSGTFQVLWRTLEGWRRGNIKQEAARRKLLENPFLLPEWVDETLEAARSTVAWGCTGEDPDGDAAFTDPPRLVWQPPRPPVFVVGMHGLAQLDLADSGYDVLAGGEHVGQLFRTEEGVYECDPDEFQIPADRSVVALLLEGHGEAPDVRQNVLQLCHDEEELAFYSAADGRRVDPARIAPGLALFLTAPRGARLEPAELGEHHHALPKLDRTLFAVPSGWAPPMRVLLEEEVLWSSSDSAVPQRLELLLKPLRDARVGLGDTVHCQVHGLPPGAEVRSARQGTHALECEKVGTAWVVALRLVPDLSQNPVTVWFTVEHGGRRRRARGRAELDLLGVARMLDGTWCRFQEVKRVTDREARETLCRVLTPGDSSARREWAILEGAVFCRRARTLPFTLGAVGGYGAPLRLQQGPFNGGSSVLLGHEVVSHGELLKLEVWDGVATLRLPRPLEPDEDHSLVWWDSQDTLVVTPAADVVEASETTWTVPIPEGVDPVRFAVCAAYRGARIGTVWTDSFRPPQLPRSPRLAAGLLRWMHLPVLARRFEREVAALAHAHPSDFLLAWVLDDRFEDLDLPGDRTQAVYEEPSPQWVAVVREVFGRWQLPSAVAGDIYDQFRALDRPPLQVLAETSPLLAFRVGAGCLEGRPDAAPDFAADARGVLGIGPEASPSEIRAMRESNLQQAAQQLGVDSGFLDGFVRRISRSTARGGELRIEGRDQANLDLACGVLAFRRVLAYELLDCLAERHREMRRRRMRESPPVPVAPASKVHTRGNHLKYRIRRSS